MLTFTYYLLPLTGIDLPPFWGVVLGSRRTAVP